MLRDIANENKKFHLITTKSDRAKIFLEKAMCDATGVVTSEVIHCHSVSDLKKRLPEMMVPPFFTSDWVCVLDLPKNESNKLEKLIPLMKQSFGVFMLYVQNYGDYKRVQGYLPKELTNTIYLSRLDKRDVQYLLGKLSVRLSEVAFKKLCSEYSHNIDAIFELIDYLTNTKGETIKTKKDLVKICGAPDPDVMAWVLQLANRLMTNSEKYKDATYKEWNNSTNRAIRSIIGKVLPVCEDKSPEYARVCLKNALKECIQLKEDYMQGLEYDTRNKTQQKIRETDLTVFVYLANELENDTRWDDECDCLNYLYRIYNI